MVLASKSVASCAKAKVKVSQKPISTKKRIFI
jgi:hypothetical protein